MRRGWPLERRGRLEHAGAWEQVPAREAVRHDGAHDPGARGDPAVLVLCGCFATSSGAHLAKLLSS